MNRTITLSKENYSQQARNINQLKDMVKISNWDDVIKEFDDYRDYIININTVNESITNYNNGRIDVNQLKDMINHVINTTNKEYHKQFNELLDELSSTNTNNITEEVEALLKRMEGM